MVRATNGSAGIDLSSPDAVEIPSGAQVSISCGKFRIPPGHVGFIRGRSGLASRRNLWAFEGTIDSDYTGEVCVLLRNFDARRCVVAKGERIAQLVIVPYHMPATVEVLTEEPRGEKGFGSSDEIVLAPESE